VDSDLDVLIDIEPAAKLRGSDTSVTQSPRKRQCIGHLSSAAPGA
jgi:hypothetical protein